MNGALPRPAKKLFEKEWQNLAVRVIQDTDIMFTTCNNAGSELVPMGFRPSTIFVDEAGQLTMPAFANVLTSFERWLAVNIFGDPKQLPPHAKSMKCNEFAPNYTMSVLELLETKGYPIRRLNIQYRMAPAISQWTAKFFYKGLLNNHTSVLVDNEYREIARSISKEVYESRGPNDQGSEYWMVDVTNGVSNVALNSTTLENHANADVLANLVDQALVRGVESSKISVLIYYKGQASILQQKIVETTQANGRTWDFSDYRQISSVDSFQGEENEFVFIDFVVAYSRDQSAPKGEEDEDDDGTEGYHQKGKFTNYVVSPKRLCCALTRGKNCVVVVGQLRGLLGSFKARQKHDMAGVSSMVQDLLKRGLVCHDREILDTSPTGQERCSKWNEATKAAEKRRNEAADMQYLNQEL